ncbi:4'-phosphopantetheinyl transferase superfamily protein [Candidatus Saccharibacteria bacterium]|nr:4'-phosphopantetheinyl transferase superfamily protein [Candidatus Saccharibacteria bacterium]
MKLPSNSREFFERSYLVATGQKIDYDSLPRTANGKPYVPDGRKFSISHTEDFWAVTIADECETEEVGMDIETRQHAKKLTPRMLRRILAPGEKAVNGDYLNNFVIKEAYFKMTGEGMSGGFKNYDANELIKKYRAADLSDDQYVWWILQGLNL